MNSSGALSMAGEVTHKIIPPGPEWFAKKGENVREPTLREILRLGFVQRGLPDEVNRWRLANTRNLCRGLKDVVGSKIGGAPTLLGLLHLAIIRRDGTRIPLGLASARVVTTAWANFLVDAMQDAESNVIDLFIYHGVGEDNTSENASDTDLGAELASEYDTDSTRATGNATEGASANVFRTVGTNTFDASVAIVEHGIFNDADVGQGVLLDRSVFSVVNLGDGESLQSTYDLTVTPGS